ncbi:MAG: hypothetical protein WCI57_04255 [Candidatus Berkelbacteria bacterium]
MNSHDYNAIAYTNDAGGTTYGIEKKRWDWPRKDKRILTTGTFWQAIEARNKAEHQQQEEEKPPF